MQEKSLIKKNILLFIENKGISKYKFYQKTKITRGVLDQNNGMSEENTARFIAHFPEVNIDWLLTGNGEMLRSEESQKAKDKNLIPFYDDVESIGGSNIVANMNGITPSTEMVDAGDWFPNATAAIRHYNDSMAEYPSGCILALKEIKNANNIIWGRNYVIETDEIRVTKKLQTCPNDNNCIMAYSTNTETYADGHLIHEPFKINKQDIRRIFMVLGRIVKEYSSGPVYVQ